MVAVALAAAGPATAKTFEVTRHNDPAPGNCKPNDCSLREAIRAANARAGKDVVVLPDRKGRYTLKRANAETSDEDAARTGDLDITGRLTLRHPGRGVATIDADEIDRVLDVRAATQVKRIKLTGGDNPLNEPPTPPRAAARRGAEGDGGGIIMHAPLALTRSSVVGNGGADYGGAIESYPLVKGNEISLVLRRSKIARNSTTGGVGGGIDAYQTNVRLVRSKILSNDAGNAGGGVAVFDGGSLRMNRTTVAGNFAETGAAGVYTGTSPTTIANSTVSGNTAGANASGGGIDVSDDVLTIVNSTVAGNSAGFDGGGVTVSGNDGQATLRSSTVVRNVADSNGAGGGMGGGIEQGSGAVVTVVNSIIALNRQDTTPDDCRGSFTSGRGNVLTAVGAGCNGFLLGAGDLLTSTPKLGALKEQWRSDQDGCAEARQPGHRPSRKVRVAKARPARAQARQQPGQRRVRALGRRALGDGAADEVDDLVGRRAGREDLGNAQLLQLGDVVGGDRAADGDDHVVDALIGQHRDDLRHQRHVGAGEDREADRVGVLLDHGGDDLLGRLVQAGVDDLHPGVAKRAGDDLRATVVSVEPRLGDDDADRAGCGFLAHPPEA